MVAQLNSVFEVRELSKVLGLVSVVSLVLSGQAARYQQKLNRVFETKGAVCVRAD